MAQTLFGLFQASAARHPDLPALDVGAHVLSYAQLEHATAGIAARIVAAHGAVPQRVGLLAARSLTAYAGYLAVLRLGATVVPMNPSFPAERNRTIAAATGLEFTLSDAAGDTPGLQLSDTDVRALANTTVAEPVEDGDPEAFAYIMFTSGSTGRPRGVPIRNRQITALINWKIRRYGCGPQTRSAQNSELTFDPSLDEMFIAWGAGGAVMVPQRADVMRPADFINRKRITHWFSVPSVAALSARVGGLGAGSAPDLGYVLFGGERLLAPHTRLWAEAAPQAEIHGTYGPTELSVMCTENLLGRNGTVRPAAANGSMPVGAILPHLEHFLLAEGAHAGDSGELCVRGPQRFDGYLDQVDNVGRFVTWEPGDPTAVVYDGTSPIGPRHWYRTGDLMVREGELLVFAGRIDDQVKVRGHRIELGEVEAALADHPAVKEAAVIAVEDAVGGTQLVAFYTGIDGIGRELTAFMRERLPLYMLPARFIHHHELPLNTNGKIDRRSLHALD